jgi:hypothetical protein
MAGPKKSLGSLGERKWGGKNAHRTLLEHEAKREPARARAHMRHCRVSGAAATAGKTKSSCAVTGGQKLWAKKRRRRRRHIEAGKTIGWGLVGRVCWPKNRGKRKLRREQVLIKREVVERAGARGRRRGSSSRAISEQESEGCRFERAGPPRPGRRAAAGGDIGFLCGEDGERRSFGSGPFGHEDVWGCST